MIEENFIIEKENNIKVYCYYFIPEDRKNIKGIVQIIHGFGEHAMRYREFASMLVNNGYAVCTLDNRGHGKTAVKNQNQKMGHIADKNGINLVLEDLHDLMEKSKINFGSTLHYTIFGHSFGSFLARAFAIRYPTEVNALVLSATKADKNFVDGVGHLIVNVQKGLFGSRSLSYFMHKMSTGGYAKKYFPEDCNSAAWLTTDKTEQIKFLEDEYCLKTPATAATYVEMLNVLDEVSKKSNINKMRKDMPILLVSGNDDILGNFGKGIEKLYKMYVNIGLTNITKKVHEGLRHEILNEKSKLVVTNDIIDWIKANTKNVSPNLERSKNIFKDFVTTSKKDDEGSKEELKEENNNESNKEPNETLATDDNKNNTKSNSVDVTTIDTKSEMTALLQPLNIGNVDDRDDTDDSHDNNDDSSVNLDDTTMSTTDEPNAETVASEQTETLATTSSEDTNNANNTDAADNTENTQNTDNIKEKPAGKKTTAKKSTPKKETSKDTTAKKTTAKKATTKKETAAKKTTAKKSTPKKETSKDTTAKKTTAKKATTKKETAAKKKTTTKKEATSKKSTTKKSTK